MLEKLTLVLSFLYKFPATHNKTYNYRATTSFPFIFTELIQSPWGNKEVRKWGLGGVEFISANDLLMKELWEATTCLNYAKTSAWPDEL